MAVVSSPQILRMTGGGGTKSALPGTFILSPAFCVMTLARGPFLFDTGRSISRVGS
jgi:hypothetical protein